MGQYDKKGTYAGYKKNNKEREALDFYATPTEEVVNILEEMQFDFNDKTILENSCGCGTMLKGILEYIEKHDQKPKLIIATDVKNRGCTVQGEYDFPIEISSGEEYDFLSDDYLYTEVDVIVMNPPFSTIEPFVLKSLECAAEVLMLGRLQFMESSGRYEKIFKDNPFTTVYSYVDRICCYKNGDFSLPADSIQAYAWFYWNQNIKEFTPTIKWIRRIDKK